MLVGWNSNRVVDLGAMEFLSEFGGDSFLTSCISSVSFCIISLKSLFVLFLVIYSHR